MPAPGVMPDGKIGVRAHRAHCEDCGWLSPRRTLRHAQVMAYGHNLEHHLEMMHVRDAGELVGVAGGDARAGDTDSRAATS